MAFAFFVDFQIAKAFLPCRVTRIPDNSKFFQSLATFERQFVLFCALVVNPLTKGKGVFLMILWNAGMTHSLYVCRKVRITLFPSRLKRIPDKSKVFQSL